MLDDERFSLFPFVQPVVIYGDHIQFQLLFARVVGLPELHVRQKLEDNGCQISGWNWV